MKVSRRRQPQGRRELHPLAVAVLKLFDDQRPKVKPFEYKYGDQVQVRTTEGYEWIGEVCYRTRSSWSGLNLYEVSNAPDMQRGSWLPPVAEYEMKLLHRATSDGFDLFDQVKVNCSKGIWIGHVLSFVRNGDETLYEVEGAPEGLVNGRFRPLVRPGEMTMLKRGFPAADDDEIDEDRPPF